MARKKEDGITYFSHECKHDANLEYIEAIHGLNGYALYFKLLERIYFEKGYYLEWNKKIIALFAKSVVLPIEKTKEIVSDMIEEGLFNKTIYEKHGYLTSRGIQKRYLEATKRRVRVEIEKEICLILEQKNEDEHEDEENESIMNTSCEHNVNRMQTETQENETSEAEMSAEMPQSKVKQSKVKESKRNNSKGNSENVNSSDSAATDDFIFKNFEETVFENYQDDAIGNLKIDRSKLEIVVAHFKQQAKRKGAVYENKSAVLQHFANWWNKSAENKLLSKIIDKAEKASLEKEQTLIRKLNAVTAAIEKIRKKGFYQLKDIKAHIERIGKLLQELESEGTESISEENLEIFKESLSDARNWYSQAEQSTDEVLKGFLGQQVTKPPAKDVKSSIEQLKDKIGTIK